MVSPVVDIKVGVPLVNDGSLAAAVEVVPQVVGAIGLRPHHDAGSAGPGSNVGGLHVAILREPHAVV
jgi:hypothetical protein